jgi:tetratricopeptide (TPR) repeat protein/predicted Ser/Thr protein kinase
MTPNTIDCPACHTPNPVSATHCTRCATPFSLDEATFVPSENPARSAIDRAKTASEKIAAAGSDSATLDGGTSNGNTLDDSTFVPEPRDDDATFMGSAKGGDITDLSAKGWSRAAPATSVRAFPGGRIPPGTLLGTRYEIVQILGEGGMGAVYKAMDRELERMVALKIIKPELAIHEDILARFKQELILARRITHKNVIRIFDLGDADGIKFITMEFIEGKDLSSLIKQKGRLTFEECAETMSQVCTALEAAHSEGVVHRDLKPQNIMVDKNNRVTVMDFGIARTMEQGGMTNTGALIGTPDYMSPEQVMGEKVDARSDLFTLGVIFYQLLIGQLPYRADTVQGAMYKRTKEIPQPPREVDPEVPQMLSDITAKCLQLEPVARYQSAAEMQQDIDLWRGGTSKRIDIPVTQTTTIVALPPEVPFWKKPTAIAISLLLLVFGIGGAYLGRNYLGGTKTTAAPAVALNSLAVLPFHNAGGDPKLDWLGSSMAEMLSTDVGQSASIRMVSADRVAQVLKDLRITPQSDLDQDTVGRVAKQSNVDTVVWGHYAQIGEQIRIDASVQDLKHGGAPKTVKEVAANEKDILPAMDRLAAQIRGNLSVSGSLVKELQAQAFKPSTASIAALRAYDQGLQNARQGNHAEAIKQFQSAAQEDPNFALAYSRLAQAYQELGQDDEAEQASQKAVKLSTALGAQEKYLIQATNSRIVKDYPKAVDAYQNLVKASPDNSDYLFDLGEAYENTSNYDKAAESFKKVVELDPKRIEGLLAMGRVLIEQGQTQSGIEFLTRAQAVAIELGDDAERAQVLQAMGVAYSTMQRYDDALKSLNDSLEIKKKLGMKKGIADSLEMMGSIQDVTGKSDLALKNYNEALGIRRDIGDKQGTGDVLTDLGQFYVEHGKYDDALKNLKEALQLQIDARNDSSQAAVLNNIGNTYLAKGDFDNAGIYYAQALQVREKLNVPGDIADTLHNLAETSVRTGQFDKAQEQYLKALELHRNAGDKRGAAIESSSMGTLFGYLGRLSAAVSAQQDALKGFDETKEQGFQRTETLLAYGNALAQAGRGDEAAKTLTDALNSAREQKSQPQIATALGYQGDNAIYRGDLKSAASAYAEAQSTAAKTGDATLILQSKVNAAKLAVLQGKYAAAVASLRALGEQADSLGMKYLSSKCLVLSGQALIGMKDYAGAQKELKTAALRSEKLGLRILSAQSHYYLGRALELSGKAADAKPQYDEAHQIAADVQKEAGSDAVTKRSDLAEIFAKP